MMEFARCSSIDRIPPEYSQDIPYYNNMEQVWIIGLKGSLLAYAIVTSIGNEKWLQHLYVVKDLRNQGVGQVLLQQVLLQQVLLQQVLSEYQSHPLTLMVARHNTSAIHIYQKYRFKVIKRDSRALRPLSVIIFSQSLK